MKLKVNGDLAVLLESFVDSFRGASARDTFGGSVTVSAGFPFAVSLSGPSLGVPETGPDFIGGTLTRMELAEIKLGGGTTVIPRLAFSEISIGAPRLFDLIDRTATSATGRFDEGAFQNVLKGDWVIEGSAKDDILAPGRWMGLAGANRILAGEGADLVNGGAGADVISGGVGADRLEGGAGDDALRGGGGGDILAGGLGDDLLEGGGGHDLFVFGRASEADEVADFDPTQDRLDLPGGDHQLRDTAEGARVLFDGGSVLLLGIEKAALTDDLFL